MQEKDIERITNSFQKVFGSKLITKNMTADQLFYQTEELSRNKLKEIEKKINSNSRKLEKQVIETKFNLEDVISESKEEELKSNESENFSESTEESMLSEECDSDSKFKDDMTAKEVLDILGEECDDELSSSDNFINSTNIEL